MCLVGVVMGERGLVATVSRRLPRDFRKLDAALWRRFRAAILVALGWTARQRARVGMALAGILLVPSLATLWTAWEKFNVPEAPDPVLLSLTGLAHWPSICPVPSLSRRGW